MSDYVNSQVSSNGTSKSWKRWLVQYVRYAAIIYLVTILVLLYLENKLIFRPDFRQ